MPAYAEPHLSPRPYVTSPLLICDRLLRLAEDADRAGLPVTAEHLLFLANTMFETEQVAQ